MPSLMLIRAQRLQKSELQQLPHPCVPIEGAHTKIVYAELDGISLREQFKMIYRLGQVVRGAEIVYHDPSVPLPEGSHVGTANPPRYAYPTDKTQAHESEDVIDAEILEEEASESPPEVPPEPPKPDFWSLVDEGEYDAAYKIIEETPPEWPSHQRVKIWTFLDEPDEGLVILACRIVLLLGWRSNIIRIKRLLQHDSSTVRIHALQIIGEFAGASMLPAVQLLRNDPVPEVSIAANTCYQRLKRR